MLPVQFPNLTYLFLGYWEIPWGWFTGFVPSINTSTGFSSSSHASSLTSAFDGKDNANVLSSREPPSLRLAKVRTVVFWKCQGLPVNAAEDDDSELRKGIMPNKKWVYELKGVWGEALEALDESVGYEKALKGNRGGGAW